MRNQRMNMTKSSYFYSPGESSRKDDKALSRKELYCEDFSSTLNRMAKTLARVGYSHESETVLLASRHLSEAFVGRSAPSITVS